VRRELRTARDKRGLQDGRRPGRYARDDGARRKAGVLRLLRGSYKGQHRRAVARERPLNWLVIQMADLAGCIGGAGVIVPNASERHGNQQQRYWNHQALNCLRSAHPFGTGKRPISNHIADVPAVQWVAFGGVAAKARGRAADSLGGVEFHPAGEVSWRLRAPFRPARRTSRRACAAARRWPAGVRAARRFRRRY
jgi:hypothetical protein